MLTDSLIDDEILADLPIDDDEAFLLIATSAREKLDAVLKDPKATAKYSPMTWRRTFIWEVSSAADKLGVEGLPTASFSEQSEGNMDAFNVTLSRIVTGIKLDMRAKLRSDAARLSHETKDTIRAALDKLREQVNGSNLSDKVKASLHRKIDAVEAELSLPRTAFGPLWTLVGAISLVATTGISTAADLPGALKTVQDALKLAHADHQAEVAHAERFAGSPRLPEEKRRLLTDQTDARVAK